MALDRSTVAVDVVANDRASATFAKIEKGAQKFARSVESALSVGLTRAAQASAAAITAAGAAVLMYGTKFESEMSRVRAVTGATEKDFAALKHEAQRLGRETVFSASEAAGGMKALGMAGYDAGQIIGAMPGMLDLAAAGVLDLDRATEITVATLSQFRMEVDQSGRVADVLAATANKSTTSVEELGQAIKFAGPVAGALNMSLEDVSAALGVLANSGIRSEMAGTALRNILVDMQSEAVRGRDAFKQLGLGQAVAADGSVDLAVLIERMSKSANVARDAVALFGDRSGPALVALVSQGVGALKKFQGELANVEGTARQVADVNLDNVPGQWKIFMSQVEGMAITVWEGGIGAGVRTVVNEMNAGMKSIGSTSADEAQRTSLAWLETARLIGDVFGGIVDVVMVPVNWVLTAAKAIGETFADLAVTIERVFTDPISAIKDAWEAVSQSAEERYASNVGRMREEGIKARQAAAAAGPQAGSMEWVREQQAAADKTTSTWTKALDAIEKQIFDSARDRDRANKAMATSSTKAATKTEEVWKKAADTIDATAVSTAESWQDALADIDTMTVKQLRSQLEKWRNNSAALWAVEIELGKRLREEREKYGRWSMAQLERMIDDEQTTEQERLEVHAELMRRMQGQERDFFHFVAAGWEEAVRQSKTANQAMLDAGRVAFEQLQAAAADSLFELFSARIDNARDAWVDLMGTMLDTFKRTVAQMVTNAAFQSLFGTLAQQQAVSAATPQLAGLTAGAAGAGIAVAGAQRGSYAQAGIGGGIAGGGIGAMSGGLIGAGIGAGIGIAVGLIATAFSNRMADEQEETDKRARELANSLSDALIVSKRETSKRVAELTGELEAVNAAMEEATATAEMYATAQATIAGMTADFLSGSRDAINELNGTTQTSRQAITGLSDRVRFLGMSLDGELSPYKLQAIEDGLGSIMDGWGDAFKNIASEIDGLRTAIDGLKKAREGFSTAISGDIEQVRRTGLSTPELLEHVTANLKMLEKMPTSEQGLGEQRAGIMEQFDLAAGMITRRGEIESAIAAGTVTSEQFRELDVIEKSLARVGLYQVRSLDELKAVTIQKLTDLNNDAGGYYDKLINMNQEQIDLATQQVDALLGIRSDLTAFTGVLGQMLGGRAALGQGQAAALGMQAQGITDKIGLTNAQDAAITGFVEVIQRAVSEGYMTTPEAQRYASAMPQAVSMLRGTETMEELIALIGGPSGFGQMFAALDMSGGTAAGITSADMEKLGDYLATHTPWEMPHLTTQVGAKMLTVNVNTTIDASGMNTKLDKNEVAKVLGEAVDANSEQVAVKIKRAVGTY